MATLQFRTGTGFLFDKAFALYEDAGWTAYTSDSEQLQQAINKSLYVLTAWSGEQLVGLLRAVGDGTSIIYVQDILVLKQFQRQGIGRRLLNQLVDHYATVRQIVLMTDTSAATTCFYENCGFMRTEKLQLQTFVRIKPTYDT